MIASFEAHGWAFEVFGQARAVGEQFGWRHFPVERRLLAQGGPSLRAAVMARRRAGTKTEPAFADALNLRGDPYETLLDVECLSDTALAGLLAEAGFGPCGAAHPR